MTDDDLTKLEKKLKIKLPEQYREVLKTLGARFREYECFQEFDASFYVNPLDVIRINAQERSKDSGTVEAFPEWWKIFVLVGTNGAGGYYCVRLDNRPGL